MNRTPMLALLALGAMLAAQPSFGATTPGQANAGSPNHSGKATANNGKWSNATSDKPADKLNPLMTAKGQVRIRKLIGTDVYNDQDKKLGTVTDLIMGKSGEPTVIIRAHGKLHQVAWGKLRFGDAQKDSHNKVLMPDETQKALQGEPAFHGKNG